MTQFAYAILFRSGLQVRFIFATIAAGAEPKILCTPPSIKKTPVRRPKPTRMANRSETENQDCWRFLTIGEKVLLFSLAITLTVLVTFFIFIVLLLLKTNTVCNTPDCVRASTKLLEIINFKANPCEDLTSFACNKEREGLESRKKMLIQEFVKGLDNSSLATPRKFYQACINSTAIEEQSRETVVSLLEKLGGWPLLEGQKWNETAFHWLQFMAKLRNLGLKSDWFIEFSWHESDNGTKLLKIGVPSKVDAIPPSRQQVYYQILVSVAVAFDSSEILAWKEIGKVAFFENNLVALRESAMNRSSDFDDTNVTVSVEELNRIWPEVNLVALLNDFANGYTVFTQHSLLVLSVESYVSELNALLAKTSRRTQANFFIWKVIETLLPYLFEEVRDKYEYYNAIGTREDFCMKETINRFYGAIEAEYVSKYVDESIQRELQEMVVFIKQEELNVVIGDPEVAFVNKDFTFASDNVIKMVNEVRFAEENDFFKCLNTNLTCDYEKYGHQSDSSEIKFDCNETIFIPNGLVQSDWYDFHQPNYLNYAGLGVAIAKAIKTCLETSTESDEELNTEDPAYLGYIKWVQQYGLERHLPGLNYTTKQLFWIYSRSTNSCLKENLERIPDSIYFLHDFRCQ